ncbi:MAG: glycosyltransferase family 4 protein [Alphaproteobacteria bacterium]
MRDKPFTILIISDAWHPQINGVVRSIEALIKHQGDACIKVIGPDQFHHWPMPGYPEIELSWPARKKLAQLIDAIAPNAIHLATEGPLGWAARKLCLKRGWPFTTAYHTMFPEYIRARLPVPTRLSYQLLRRFHQPAAAILVATEALATRLKNHGFNHVVVWARGVDTQKFCAGESIPLPQLQALPTPFYLYVGRIAVEKNLEAFLSLPLTGTKLVVGDGPALQQLQQKYPDAVFLGKKTGEELVNIYRLAHLFVFPSLTDTFGLVMLEALACGLPVAAFPAEAPMAVLSPQQALVLPHGVMDHDLRHAIEKALLCSPHACRAYAQQFDWQEITTQFINYQRPLFSAQQHAS